MKKRKLKFKSQNSNFDALVGRAVDVTKRLAHLRNSGQLTADAYVRELLEISGTPRAKIEKLIGMLDSDSGVLRNARASLSDTFQYIRSRRMHTPPKNLARLNFLMTEKAMAELGAKGFIASDLVAAACVIEGKRDPSLFGECESSADHANAIASAKQEQQELYEKIDRLILDSAVLAAIQGSAVERGQAQRIVEALAAPKPREKPADPLGRLLSRPMSTMRSQ